MRWVAAAGLLLLLSLAFAPSRWRAQGAQSPTDFDRSVVPFLARTCYQCHNAELKSGGLNLEGLRTSSSITQNREIWERVLRKLRAGEMPPKSLPRPNPEELKTVVSWIEAEFARADRLLTPDPGRVTLRRLNRAEYNNTVRDLLGVDLRPADNFPQDDSGYGFDNIGDVLSLSPVLMEKYLAAAERVARAAMFGPEQMKPTMVKLRSSGQRIIPSRKPLFDYDSTGLTLPNAIHITHRFPVDGEYILRVFLGGSRPLGSEPFLVALWIDGQQVQSIELDPTKTAAFDEGEKQDLGGKVQEFRATVSAGEHWVAASILRLYEGLPARYQGPNPSRIPFRPPRQFKPPENLPPARIEEIRKRFETRIADIEKAPVNDARLSSLEIGGPYNQAGGPSAESLKRIYACGHLSGHHQAGCARKIVADLARRAFRRPVTAEEIDKLAGLISLVQKQGDSFEEGLCQSLQAMLVSPHFLFRIEQGRRSTAAGDSLAISDHEFATRLSYFLWSSMPDDDLMKLADQHALRRPGVLEGQIRRMLRDPRSQALVENFGGQWLELRKLESVKPDRQRFPDFDEYLRMSMRRETELFFESIVQEDRSILDFIDADYTFINERLAKLYKIPNVKGPEFRKVVLAGDTQRGGVLTQAGILTVSSYATRTSPVLRGKWILEKILNAPPPPPLPDVPNLDESKIGSAASLRQQLEAHRQNATCASCHVRMDPLGFGLENFDAIGAWRTQDGKFPIDSSGMLPDGRSFKGPAELKTILKQDQSAFAEGVTEKLLIYALGRGLESYDRPTVKQIVTRLAAGNYRFSTLVIEIAGSLPFQSRRQQ
jgi:mono/diheme cytochrome c family protein